jgi:hypothetical protein
LPSTYTVCGPEFEHYEVVVFYFILFCIVKLGSGFGHPGELEVDLCVPGSQILSKNQIEPNE